MFLSPSTNFEMPFASCSPCPLAAHLWLEQLRVERRPHPDALCELGLGGDAQLHVAHGALADALDRLHRRRQGAAVRLAW